MPPSSDETSRTELGRSGEDLAARHLLDAGYRLLERNYRIRQGEIDLIAQEGALLCFVEVRSKRTAEHGHPLETVDHRKRGRLLRAARHYLATRCEGRDVYVRFDVLAIVYEPTLELTLVRDAFQSPHWG